MRNLRIDPATLARAAVVVLSLLATAALPAKTLRWSSRGDAQSMDPYAANENVTYNLVRLSYEGLVRRGDAGEIAPALATGWQAIDPRTWRFTLRANVRFQDGTPFTADDAVFSIERAQQASSQIAQYARRLGKPVALDPRTVDLRLSAPDPLLLEHLDTIAMMSRAWCVAHGAERVPAYNAHEEGWSSMHAMGTGAYVLVRREPGTRTIYERNPDWWGWKSDPAPGNVTRVEFVPITNDATRMAALLSGDLDLIQGVPPQDQPRVAGNPALRLSAGPENRIIFLGFDQASPELAFASVKGRNPFRDVRVRQAFDQAIDAGVLKSKIMRGLSVPTACLTTAAVGCTAPELETRPPADVGEARRLMAAAGYGDGFDLTLDCPNDRYVNDQELCIAIGGMLARIGVRIRVDARPKALYFPRVQRHETSFYLYGWGGGITDAQIVLDPIVHSFDAATQKGGDNNGGLADAALDRLIDEAAVDTDPSHRGATLAAALRHVHEQAEYIPLHRQMLLWASRAKVRPVMRPDDLVFPQWLQIDD